MFGFCFKTLAVILLSDLLLFFFFFFSTKHTNNNNKNNNNIKPNTHISARVRVRFGYFRQNYSRAVVNGSGWWDLLPPGTDRNKVQ